jgi:hypothetical protein
MKLLIHTNYEQKLLLNARAADPRTSRVYSRYLFGWLDLLAKREIRSLKHSLSFSVIHLPVSFRSKQ